MRRGKVRVTERTDVMGLFKATTTYCVLIQVGRLNLKRKFRKKIGRTGSRNRLNRIRPISRKADPSANDIYFLDSYRER